MNTRIHFDALEACGGCLREALAAELHDGLCDGCAPGCERCGSDKGEPVGVLDDGALVWVCSDCIDRPADTAPMAEGQAMCWTGEEEDIAF